MADGCFKKFRWARPINPELILQSSELFFPRAIRMAGEFGIIKFRVVRNFFADPLGEVDRLVLVLEFDLGDAQALVVAMENVDFPFHARVVDDVAGFVDERTMAEREQALGVGGWDRVLEFEAGNSAAGAFNGERGGIAGEADADAFTGVGKKVALAEPAGLTDDLGAPRIADEEEFALNFQGAVGSYAHRRGG
jgi:hypothetical protein